VETPVPISDTDFEQLPLWEWEHSSPHFRTTPDRYGCTCVCMCPLCAQDNDLGEPFCICEDCFERMETVSYHESPHLIDGSCDCACDECTPDEGGCICTQCDGTCGAIHV
jgi:hypothetical protein